ncbi:hypothetical protein ACFQ0I_09620 [Mariniflexile aquimaris]|uniref:PD-(D/E)XK nuclease superfamily protein n=1 Tax=Mariniflexile aquimaris TaxID=881009 RepID=A0ABW3BU60_9FLAO
MMDYKKLQRKLQVQKLIYKYPELFNHDKGGGSFDKYDSLIFVLKDGENNLFAGVKPAVLDYFKNNEIAWWGDDEKFPSGHMLSSQIQCLNFLFAIRKDEEAVLKLAQLFNEEIGAVFPVAGDKEPTYLAFEFVFDNKALLKEDDEGAKRGAFCTSVDAFLIAAKNGRKLLIPIEWKYTESYLAPQNKALESRKGKTRQARYNQLIYESNQLKTPVDLEQSIYYFEPYYELMRQTLLVEQMVGKGVADDFLHILVAPEANTDFLQKSYSFEEHGLIKTWENHLEKPEKFIRVDSRQILNLLEQMPNYLALSKYLKLRYN